jgi:glycosyltransferase involved in cell wall biosynthesis
MTPSRKPGGVLLFREERFIRTPDGNIWSRWGTGADVWEPYLAVFSSVTVVARIVTVLAPEPGWTLSSGQHIEFRAVRPFHGALQYLSALHLIAQQLKDAVDAGEALILRVPSPLANTLSRYLYRTRRTFAVEVAGDPYAQFAPGAMRHPLRPLFRWWFASRQRFLCRHASCLRYVTKHALQQEYPASYGASVFSISDVYLPEEAYNRQMRPFDAKPIRLIFVGMLEQLYKGQDVLVDAMAQLIRNGVSVHLRIVGDGKYRRYLEHLAFKLGVAFHIDFVGVCNHSRIRSELDNADLFVLPSRQEGTPRAMLEAMARSLPCIGTTVGGIPEILPVDYLVPPGSSKALSEKVAQLAKSPQALIAAAQRNYGVARQYRLSVRRSQEINFLSSVASSGSKLK